MPPFSDLFSHSKHLLCRRVIEDKWNSDPPQVTSFLSFPRAKTPSTEAKVKYDSPTCGFGWQFQLVESFRQPAPDSQALVGHLDVSFKPSLLFASLPLSNVVVSVKVTYPTNPTSFTHEKTFNNVSLKVQSDLGSYEEPAEYTGSTVIAISLIFSTADGLSLPTSPSVDFKAALCESLNDPVFIDTKFYLYSAKKRGVPTQPKAVFAKSSLLLDSSSYLHNLLSSGTGFKSGTQCDLRGDVPEEVAKLSADAYEYDSDSDLESLPDDEDEEIPETKDHGPGSLADVSNDETDKETEVKSDSSDGTIASEGNPQTSSLLGALRGQAIAINGTAYQTWKAFMFYTYTSNIHFNALKSQNNQDDTTPDSTMDSTMVGCSPKSMYRFADYADLPTLRALAKEGIRKGLTKSNIVAELFSTFTYKYQEIIEMEVDFLLKDFTPRMGRELDEMLQFVVLGTKPHCYRVLAFILRRQRGESSQDAWRVLDGGEIEPPSPPPAAPKSRPPTPPAAPATQTAPTQPIVTPPQVTPQPTFPQLWIPGGQTFSTTSSAPSPQVPRPFSFATQPAATPQAIPRSAFFFNPPVQRNQNSNTRGSSTGGGTNNSSGSGN